MREKRAAYEYEESDADGENTTGDESSDVEDSGFDVNVAADDKGKDTVSIVYPIRSQLNVNLLSGIPSCCCPSHQK